MGNLCTSRPQKDQDLNMNVNTQKNFKLDDSRSLFVTQQYQTLKQINSRNNEEQQQLSRKSSIIDELQKEQNLIFEAKENNDIEYLIDQMNNDKKLDKPYNINHQWAQSPNSLGSIATMLLSIFFMRELQPDQQPAYQEQEAQIYKYFQYFKNQSVIQRIKINIENTEIDRVHITILLLVFLIEFQEIHPILIQNQIYQSTLIQLNKKNKNSTGFRLACGYILRELFKNNQQLIDIFMNENQAIETIIEFLDSDDLQYIMEGLNMIDDLITDQSQPQQLNLFNCKKLYDFGFFIQLQKTQIKLQTNQQDNSDQDIDEQLSKQTIMDLTKTLMTRILQFSKKQ